DSDMRPNRGRNGCRSRRVRNAAGIAVASQAHDAAIIQYKQSKARGIEPRRIFPEHLAAKATLAAFRSQSPDPCINRAFLMASKNAGRIDLDEIMHAIEMKGVADQPVGEGRAIYQRAVVGADRIEDIALGAPPGR